MRLRPGVQLLWRHEGASQVHADPTLAVVLDDLTVPEQALLDGLRTESTEGDLERRGRRLGLEAARVRELLTRLAACGALRTSPPDPSLVHLGLTPDLEHWSRVLGADADEMLAGRPAATVAVLGLDRIGIALATTLATAGVGTLLLSDPRRVRPDDVGTGYAPGDVGQPRAARARALLGASHPRLRTSAPPGTRPDLVVVLDQDVSDPVRLRPLVREDVAHLLVVAREADVVVGPLVTPGDGACGRCVELHRTDEDPRWPALATQLLGSAPRGVESSLAVVAAGTAAAETLAHLDGRPVATAGVSLLLDARRPVPRTRQWPVHRDCGCTGLPPGPVSSGDRGALARPAAATLGGDDLTGDEDLAAPHAPGLLAGEGPAQAGLTHRAAPA